MFGCWDPGGGTCPRRDVGSRPSLLPLFVPSASSAIYFSQGGTTVGPRSMTQVHISSSQDSPRYFVMATESRNTSYLLAMFVAFSYHFIFHKQKQQQQKWGQLYCFLFRSVLGFPYEIHCFLFYLDVYCSFPGAFHRSPLFLSPVVQWQANFFLSSCLL